MKLKGMAGTLRTLKDMEAEIEERFERNDAALYKATTAGVADSLEEKHQWIEDTLMQLQDAIELLEDVRDSKMED